MKGWLETSEPSEKSTYVKSVRSWNESIKSGVEKKLHHYYVITRSG